MIRILHTADWHLDAPLREFTDDRRRLLRQAMLELPGRIADVCVREGCDICLIAGDVFDGPGTRDSIEAVGNALERMRIPVFVAPGNHDPFREDSPWDRAFWPENVHIFTRQEITSVRIPELDCRVYGAAFTGPVCPGLLEGFRAGCTERHALLVLHADPTGVRSAYNPVTASQLREAGLDYAALGHIHAAGQLEAGGGLCAWPGCPMGRGWDETGPKGVLITEVGETVRTRFVPLGLPGFYEYTIATPEDPLRQARELLPPEGSRDFFRLRLTGEMPADAARSMQVLMSAYPNLTILDESVPMGDLWETAGTDSLEGIFFQTLREELEGADPEKTRTVELAARIARKILRGWEVELP